MLDVRCQILTLTDTQHLTSDICCLATAGRSFLLGLVRAGRLGLRFDGLGRSAGALAADLYAPGLDLFALLKHDAQDAVLVLGRGVLRRDRLRQRERARERAVGALDAVEVVAVVLLLEAPLAA